MESLKRSIGSRYALLIPAVVAIIIYLPALQAGFVWDDTIFLVDLPLYRLPANWGAALAKPFLLSPNYYRPVALLTFLLELRAVGLTPWVFHLTNILLHAINALLVTLLAARLTKTSTERSNLLAVGAGVLYAVHPALVEGTAFISSRFDLLMTSILLGTLLLEWRLARWRAAAVLAGGTLLAFLSKEMTVGFLAAYPLWWWASRRLEGRSDRLYDLARRWGGVAAGVVLGLIIRGLVLGRILPVPSPSSLNVGGLLPHALLVARSVGEYVILTVWPFTSLSPIHFARLPLSPTDLAGWLALAGSLTLLAVLLKSLADGSCPAWLLASALAALIPVLNVIPLELGGGAFAAERFLTFPLALAALSVAAAISTDWYPDRGRLRRWLGAGVGVWLVGAVAVVQATLPHWQSDPDLWAWATERAPLSPVPYTNLALDAVNVGAYEQGLSLAEQALTLDPASLEAQDNKGLALFHLGRYAEAETVFSDLTQRAPGNIVYWNNLAGALREQGKLSEAEHILRDQVLSRDPQFPTAHLNLGIVYLRADRPDLARQELELAIKQLPPSQSRHAQDLMKQTQDPARWLRLADLMLSKGQPQAALSALDTAEKLGAAPLDVALGRSISLTRMGQLDTAEALLNQILQAGVADARVYNNLGLIAQQRGDLAQAQADFQHAIQLAPNWGAPQQNLKAIETK